MNDITLYVENPFPVFDVSIDNKLPSFEVSIQTIESVGEIHVGLTTPGPKGDPGNTLVCKAAYPISGQRIVSLNASNEAEYPSDFSQALGLTTNAAIGGDYLTVITGGLVYEPSWTLTPNQAVYLSVDGLLTQTVPTTGTLLQIGFAVSPTEMFIKLGTPIILH